MFIACTLCCFTPRLVVHAEFESVEHFVIPRGFLCTRRYPEQPLDVMNDKPRRFTYEEEVLLAAGSRLQPKAVLQGEVGGGQVPGGRGSPGHLPPCDIQVGGSIRLHCKESRGPIRPRPPGSPRPLPPETQDVKKPAWKEPPFFPSRKQTSIEVRWLSSSTPPQIFLPKAGGVSVMAGDALPQWTLMEGEARGLPAPCNVPWVTGHS